MAMSKERNLINVVCKKLENYIQQLSPSNIVYIAFDGVAPVAKLNQQRNRRYKSSWLKKIKYESNIRQMGLRRQLLQVQNL